MKQNAQQVWIFGYGSLIWDTGTVERAEVREGFLNGWRREWNWISASRHGAPTCSLERGEKDHVKGIFFRLNQDTAERDLETLRARENQQTEQILPDVPETGAVTHFWTMGNNLSDNLKKLDEDRRATELADLAAKIKSPGRDGVSARDYIRRVNNFDPGDPTTARLARRVFRQPLTLGDRLRYLYLLRVPVLMGGALAALPLVSLYCWRELLGNLFVLSEWNIFWTTMATVMLTWSILVVSRVVLLNGQNRFGVRQGLLFTDAPQGTDKVAYLENPLQWKAYITENFWKSVTRKVTAVNLLQMDIAVRDARADGPGLTGWVFGTFVYNGQLNNSNKFMNLVPVGLIWGDEPENRKNATSGAYPVLHTTVNPELKETVIFESKDLPPQHLGWNQRLNGPADLNTTSCLACHVAAQYPAVTSLVPPTAVPDGQKDPPKDGGSDEWMKWFQNLRCATPMNEQTYSTDFSFQVAISLENFFNARSVIAQGSWESDYKLARKPIARGELTQILRAKGQSAVAVASPKKSSKADVH